jgi:hypothetical protein
MSPARNAQRVALKIEAVAASTEAQLLNYVKQDPITPSREVALRALKAFYLPWALEGEVSEGELAAIAQSAIEELQFRIFQIRQRYLNPEHPAYKPTAVPNPNGHRPTTADNVAPSLPPPGTSLESMRESINPADLDDF